jgi:hypothetical protein
MRGDLLGAMPRREFFRDHPPARICLFRDRLSFLAGGDPNTRVATRWETSWYVWEPGFRGDPTVSFMD